MLYNNKTLESYCQENNIELLEYDYKIKNIETNEISIYKEILRYKIIQILMKILSQKSIKISLRLYQFIIISQSCLCLY
jgi:hypothetical protein